MTSAVAGLGDLLRPRWSGHGGAGGSAWVIGHEVSIRSAGRSSANVAINASTRIRCRPHRPGAALAN